MASIGNSKNFLMDATGDKLKRDLVRFSQDINEFLKKVNGFLKAIKLGRDLVRIPQEH